MTTKNTIAIAKRPQPKKELELLEVELKRIEVQERLRGMEHTQSFRPKSEEDRLNLEKINTLNIQQTLFNDFLFARLNGEVGLAKATSDLAESPFCAIS